MTDLPDNSGVTDDPDHRHEHHQTVVVSVEYEDVFPRTAVSERPVC